ncbi:MAG: hypothetical protein WBF06_04305, partial [Candidatus Acidiferrales bacterium]
RIVDGHLAWMLTGDIERPIERSLVDDGDPLACDFLKVAHHGSKTSTTDGFVAAAHPRFAAISVGFDNSYGHPAAEVVDRLEAAGAVVYRTDRDGAITSLGDGNQIEVSTYLHPPQQNSSAAAGMYGHALSRASALAATAAPSRRPFP